MRTSYACGSGRSVWPAWPRPARRRSYASKPRLSHSSLYRARSAGVGIPVARDTPELAPDWRDTFPRPGSSGAHGGCSRRRTTRTSWATTRRRPWCRDLKPTDGLKSLKCIAPEPAPAPPHSRACMSPLRVDAGRDPRSGGRAIGARVTYGLRGDQEHRVAHRVGCRSAEFLEFDLCRKPDSERRAGYRNRRRARTPFRGSGWLATRRILSISTARAWTPIGQNDAIPWTEFSGLIRRRDLHAVERHLALAARARRDLSAADARILPGRHRHLESPAGAFRPEMVRLWDDLIALCERYRLYLLLTPFDTFFTWNNWDAHPYNRANGGPCADRTRLLTCPETRALIKARLAFATGALGRQRRRLRLGSVERDAPGAGRGPARRFRGFHRGCRPVAARPGE